MILETKTRRTLTGRAGVVGLTLAAALLLPLAVARPVAKAQDLTPTPQPPLSQTTMDRAASPAAQNESDATQVINAGRTLTPQAAVALEQTLGADPGDETAHLKLLGYYEGGRFDAGAVGAAYQKQVFWLIQNHPDAVFLDVADMFLLKRSTPAAFEKGRTLWLEQVSKHPRNATILGNAANYCLLSDDQTAEKLLRQAETLEPKNPQWPNKLGELYSLRNHGYASQNNPLLAQKALTEFEAASALANKTSLPSASADLAKTAFDAGEYDKARRYATELLKRGQNQSGAWDSDNNIHQGNLILGRLALRDGDTAGAEAHLLAMGRIAGSPQLDSFGPNMQLAEDLLKAGKRDTVLTYFDECAKFWKYPQLAQWRSEVQKGKTPDFGANLVY